MPSAMPAPQPNPYLAQMQAMQAQMMAMQQAMAGMGQAAQPVAAAKKTRKTRTPKDPNAPKQPIPEGTSAWISYVQLIRTEIDARMRSVDPAYTGVSFKDAMQEAKRLKALGDPRYQYTPKAKAPVAPKQAFTPLPLPTGATLVAQPAAATNPFPFPFPTPVPQAVAAAPAPAPKKLVRKPAATPAPLPIPAAPMADLFSFPAPTPIPAPAAITQLPTPDVFAMASMTQTLPAVPTSAPKVEEEEELVLEEETINGITYLMSPKKECWLMDADGTQGAWAGIYNGSTIDDTAEEPNY